MCYLTNRAQNVKISYFVTKHCVFTSRKPNAQVFGIQNFWDVQFFEKKILRKATTSYLPVIWNWFPVTLLPIFRRIDIHFLSVFWLCFWILCMQVETALRPRPSGNFSGNHYVCSWIYFNSSRNLNFSKSSTLEREHHNNKRFSNCLKLFYPNENIKPFVLPYFTKLSIYKTILHQNNPFLFFLSLFQM